MLRIDGRILDENQRPVAGAHVTLGDHRAITGAAGDFAFEVAPGRYTVTAAAGDLFAGPAVVTAGETIFLAARRGTTLVVRVDTDRAALPGATVDIAGRVAIADADGVATIRGLPPGQVRGEVRAAGSATEQLEVRVGDDAGGVIERRVTLQPGVRVSGVVRGPFGRPSAGADVVLWDRGRVYVTRADDGGAWEIDVPAASYLVSVDTDLLAGRVTVRAPARDVVVRLLPSLHAVRRVIAPRPARIAGVVRDEVGKPVVGAFVRAFQGEHLVCGTALSDRRGRFELDALPVGDYTVRVARSVIAVDGPTQDARTGDTAVELLLPRGGTITGRVLLDGAPLTYFGVRVQYFVTGFSATDGRFTLRHVEPGRRKIQILGATTRRTEIDGIEVERGDVVDLGDIAMERGRRITGVVRDVGGAPVAHARVIVGLGFLGGSSRLEQWFNAYYEATSNADGAYVIEGIDPWPPPAHMPFIRATHLSAGESLLSELPSEDGPIDFVLLGAGRITGVVDHVRGGRPCVLAERADEPTETRRASLEPTGAYVFDALPPGEYMLRLDLPASEQGPPVRVMVIDGETIFVRLAMSSASVDLTIVVPVGRGSDLVIEPLGGIAYERRLRGFMRMQDEDHCRLSFVPPGRYRISLDGTIWREVVIAPEPAAQTIELLD